MFVPGQDQPTKPFVLLARTRPRVFRVYRRAFRQCRLRSATLPFLELRLGLGLHDLRHTYCSRLAMGGVPPWKIAQFAGYVSTQTTEAYAHFAPSADDADTVDQAFAPTETVEEDEPTSGEQLVELLRSAPGEQLAEALVLTREGE